MKIYKPDNVAVVSTRFMAPPLFGVEDGSCREPGALGRAEKAMNQSTFRAFLSCGRLYPVGRYVGGRALLRSRKKGAAWCRATTHVSESLFSVFGRSQAGVFAHVDFAGL